MVREMGLATITMGGLFLVLVSGTGTVAAEFRTGSILTVMSKPVRRNELVLGKFLGIMLTLAVVTVILTAMFFCMLWLREGHSPFLRGEGPDGLEPFAFGAMKAVLLIVFELSMVAALVVFTTLLTSRPAAAVISFAAFTLGHLSGGPAAWLPVQAGWAGRVAASLLPKLEFFRVTQIVIEGHPPGWGYLLLGLAYAATGTAILLLPAILVLKRREIR